MGKTAVFVLLTLQQIEPVAGQVAALVLCHTRELAYQIYHEFERFTTYLHDIKAAVFYDGVNIKSHGELLKNEYPHVVVGAPGRILALAREMDLPLKNVRHLFLTSVTRYSSHLNGRGDTEEEHQQPNTLSNGLPLIRSSSTSPELSCLIWMTLKMHLHGYVVAGNNGGGNNIGPNCSLILEHYCTWTDGKIVLL